MNGEGGGVKKNHIWNQFLSIMTKRKHKGEKSCVTSSDVITAPVLLRAFKIPAFHVFINSFWLFN